jgi:hypothetical protein
VNNNSNLVQFALSGLLIGMSYNISKINYEIFGRFLMTKQTVFNVFMTIITAILASHFTDFLDIFKTV